MQRGKVLAAVELTARVGGLFLFVYGLAVFADQGAGELIKRGVAYFVSPYIWGSNFTWPRAGFIAFEGLMASLFGFFVVRFKPRQSDSTSEISHFWPFMRAFNDTLVLFFGLCVVWEALLSVYEPHAMYIQVIQYLYGTGITNYFVLNFSLAMLVVVGVFRLRGVLFVWLPPAVSPKKLTLGFGLLTLAAGAAILTTSVILADSYNVVGTLAQPLYYSCQEKCYLMNTLVFVGLGVGVVMLLAGGIIAMERLFPREPTLW